MLGGGIVRDHYHRCRSTGGHTVFGLQFLMEALRGEQCLVPFEQTVEELRRMAASPACRSTASGWPPDCPPRR